MWQISSLTFTEALNKRLLLCTLTLPRCSHSGSITAFLTPRESPNVSLENIHKTKVNKDDESIKQKVDRKSMLAWLCLQWCCVWGWIRCSAEKKSILLIYLRIRSRTSGPDGGQWPFLGQGGWRVERLASSISTVPRWKESETLTFS